MSKRPLDSERVFDEDTLDVNQGAPPLAKNQMIQSRKRKTRVIRPGFILGHCSQAMAAAPRGWRS